MAKKRMVLGQCEKVMFNQGGWKKARQEQQMRDWFGAVPVYLITVDAAYCENTTDREFCRLIEHELYHIGVERDDDGEPIYRTTPGCRSITWLAMTLKCSLVKQNAGARMRMLSDWLRL
jgi:hypothetical protein